MPISPRLLLCESKLQVCETNSNLDVDLLSLFLLIFPIPLLSSGSFQCVNLFSQVPQLSQAKVAARKISELVDASKHASSNGKLPCPTTCSLSAKDLSFSYSSRPSPVLSGASFAAEVGSFISIVGPSGSGKSTVVSLIERFYEADEGQILYSGIDVLDIELGGYRSKLALVIQEPSLFSTSIRENLLLGVSARSIKDDDIDQAMKQASIFDTVRGLPEGESSFCYPR